MFESRSRSLPPAWWHLVRAAATAAAVLVGGAVTLRLCAGPLLALGDALTGTATWPPLPLDLLVEVVAAATLALVCAWLGLAFLVALLEAVGGHSSALARAVTPTAVRRVVALCCGVAVSGGALALPASAAQTPSPADDRPGALSGLRLPDRQVGGPPVREAGPPRAPVSSASLRQTSAPARPGTPRRHRYTVRTGDSLWTIAARDLPPGAGPEQVSTAWRTVYRLNRAAIGPDPDLLTPGTVLDLPRSPAPADAPHPRKDAS